MRCSVDSARKTLDAYCRTQAALTKAEIDAAYWRFTRCRSAGPVPGDLYRRRSLYRRILRRWRPRHG